jgi:hypothetical protein
VWQQACTPMTVVTSNQSKRPPRTPKRKPLSLLLGAFLHFRFFVCFFSLETITWLPPLCLLLHYCACACDCTTHVVTSWTSRRRPPHPSYCLHVPHCTHTHTHTLMKSVDNVVLHCGVGRCSLDRELVPSLRYVALRFELKGHCIRLGMAVGDNACRLAIGD